MKGRAANDGPDKPADHIDLDEVARLLDALGRDLAKVRSGSRDMQLLRDEVETLKNVLNSPTRRHHSVREGLQGMQRSIEHGLDAAKAEGLKAGQYLAEIGRILGM
jgi:cell division septum initiation protein DivIVA